MVAPAARGRHLSGPVLPLNKRLRWLVLAPHPDDETLGAGALICDSARRGCLAGIVYLTDGGGSHPVMGAARRQLVSIRANEAWQAVRTLTGNHAPRPVHLGWEDAHPAPSDSETFATSVARLAGIIRRRRINAVAVTAQVEPHCDHVAAAHLAWASARKVGGHVSVFEYVVWAPDMDRTLRRYVTAPLCRGRRRSALACHRSQLTGLLGPGFRLPPNARAMPDRDCLYRRKEKPCAAIEA